MRFVHCADWHLGRRLLGYSLIEDQALALAQIELLCVDARADALVVAGDVFDRAVPPVEAVSLLDDFLDRMARRARIPVIAIAGNHDGAERLGFGARLLAKSGIHLRTRLDERSIPIVLPALDGEPVAFYALPFVDPERARVELEALLAAPRGADASNRLRSPPQLAPSVGHDAAARAAMASIRVDRRQHARAVLVAHAFCRGGMESIDSERPLAVGGAAQVPTETFEGFDYVALGHLHRPQRVGDRETVRYAGSLLQYSIEEHSQTKGALVVEVDREVRARFTPIAPRRALVRLEATFEQLLAHERFAVHAGDYVAATYTDATYVLHAAERLRERFPWLLEARPGRLESVQGSGPSRARPDAPAELLAAFWRYVEPGFDLEAAHVEAFERALERASREQAT